MKKRTIKALLVLVPLLTVALALAAVPSGCGNNRVFYGAFGSFFSSKPYLITLLNPLNPPSSIKKLLGTDLASSSFEDINFDGSDMWGIMRDLGKTPKCVVGQPFAVIAGDLGNSPFIHMRGRDCPILYHVEESGFNALLCQVPANVPDGKNPVRGHKSSGRGSIYLPIQIYRLGVVVNTDNKSISKFEARKAYKFGDNLEVPAGYQVDEVILSHDGLWVMGSDAVNDAFMVWPIVDLPLDLIDKEGSLDTVTFPVTMAIQDIPGAEGLPPIALNPKGLAISPDGNYLACACSNIATVVIVNISTLNNLVELVTNNDLDCTSNFSLSIVNLSLDDNPNRLAFSPSGDYVLTTNYASNSISVINNTVNPAVLVGTIDLATVGRNPQEIDFTVDPVTGNETAYVVLALPPSGTSNGKVISFDLTSYASAPMGPPSFTEYEVGHVPVGIAIDSNYRFAAVSNFADDNVSIIDLDNGSVLAHRIPSPGGPTCVERYNKQNRFWVSNRLDNSMMAFRLKDDGTLRRNVIKYVEGLSQPQSIAIQQNPDVVPKED